MPPARRYEAIVLQPEAPAAVQLGTPASRLVGVLRARGLDLVWVADRRPPPPWLTGGRRGPGLVHVVEEHDAAIELLAARGLRASEVLVVERDEDVVPALLDQWRRRRTGELPSLEPEAGWVVATDGLDERRERAVEAVLTLADGRIGTSGSPLGEHPAAAPRTLAAGVYVGAGPETELLECPVWTRLTWPVDRPGQLRRRLDLRAGVVVHELVHGASAARAVALSSLARPGTVALRAEGPAGWLETGGPLLGAADGGAPVERATVAGASGGVAVAARDTLRRAGDATRIDRLAAYMVDGESRPTVADAARALSRTERLGFDALLTEHRAAWAARWDDADVRIEGDDELQLAVRFGLFQLMASVADRGEAAVGARGISGPGYRGHVFWDTDVFVLPFLAATCPPAARAILEYRLRRLGAAREAARELERDGARFAWESAGDGRDVTPPSVRDRTGRIVPIRTGEREEHITADVAWAAACYIDWTADDAFADGPARELFAETARYWASRIRLDEHGRGHIYGVVGPDEYHEPVDDNAFTNVMARWTLRRALQDVAIGAEVERERWQHLADALVDGFDPATGLYEEFAGFFRLEPLVISELAARPVSAPLLLGAERTANAQVLKQADVLMLHHLVPHETAAGSLRANLDFYEPRTAHGSSLSPAIHAALLARTGQLDQAVEWLRRSSRLDLDDVGDSTSGGLHLATMGGVWQALVMGFAGLRPFADALALDPVLPEQWDALELRLRYQGSRVRIRIEHEAIEIAADPSIPVALAGRPGRVAATAAGTRLVLGGGPGRRHP